MNEIRFSDVLNDEIVGRFGPDWKLRSNEVRNEIVARGREVHPSFSRQRFDTLLNGLPPSNDDRKAIDHAFEFPWPETNWDLEDEFRQVVRRVGLSTKYPPMVKDIAERISGTDYRYGNLTDAEVDKLAQQYIFESQLPVEMEVFNLVGHDFV